MSQLAPLPTLLTTGEVADLLHETIPRIIRQARRGLIPCILLPSGDFVFDRAEIAAWLDSLRKRATHAR
jgi:hypothetical protein